MMVITQFGYVSLEYAFMGMLAQIPVAKRNKGLGSQLRSSIIY